MIKNYIVIDKLITKYKAFSFEVGKDTDWDKYDIFQVNFQWTWNADHPGPKFSISIAKFYLNINIYDKRHFCNESDI